MPSPAVTNASVTVSRIVRVFHGPTNVAGIGRYFADWQRQHGFEADFITYTDRTQRQNHHVNLQLERFNPIRRLWIQFTFFVRCLFRYDIFHFYYGNTLLPFNLDLPILRLAGKSIVMNYCGSEVRLASVEERRNPFYSLLNGTQEDSRYEGRKRRMMRWQNLWVHRFIAIRDNYHHVREEIPEHKIDHQINFNVLNLSAWTPTYNSPRPIPLIVHAPSSLSLKGTEYVEAAIEELRHEGLAFQYRRVHGVRNDEAQRIFREEADIIVDQLLLGSFGNLAVEAMYYGKPVCCYLNETLKQAEFPDCPIVNVTVHTLKIELAKLIQSADERIRLGKEGRAYVERHFDIEIVGRKLTDLYLSI